MGDRKQARSCSLFVYRDSSKTGRKRLIYKHVASNEKRRCVLAVTDDEEIRNMEQESEGTRLEMEAKDKCGFFRDARGSRYNFNPAAHWRM